MKKKVLISLLAFMVLFAGCSAVKENNKKTTKKTTESQKNVSNDESDVEETKVEETKVDETEETDTTEATEKDEYLHFYENLEYVIGDDDEVEITIDDFDMDGTNEAFAFVGTIYEDESMGTLYSGAFYFVTDDSYVLIKESYPVDFGDCGEVLDFGSRKYFKIYNRYMTSGISELYSVKDGNYYEESCSGLGYVYNLSGNDFSITYSDYDAIYDISIDAYIGHSWKPYYFYYDSMVDTIVEYIGEENSIEEAATYLPDGVLDEIIAEGYVIDNAFIRGNGIVNVNYHFEEDGGCIQYKNLNYDINNGVFDDAWGTGENDWKSSNHGGTYYASIRRE